MHKTLKNYPWDCEHLVKDPIVIAENDPQWNEAYSNWISGKNPTADPRWKLGVFLGYTGA
jgi:hypothetical protein